VSPLARPRLRPLDPAEVRDERLAAVLARAERLSAPRPAWYLTLAHAPEMAVGYADWWELTHRGGRVEHTVKELMRIAISTLLGCGFCAVQRSETALEEGLDEQVVEACASPQFDHPDPRVRAALRYARALVLDGPTRPADWDAVYAELRAAYDDDEVVELGCFAAMALGGVKLSRSINEP